MTPPNEDAIIAAVKREPCRSSRDTVRELGLSQSRVLKLLLDDEVDPYHFLRNVL
jgi:hypothetical protein